MHRWINILISLFAACIMWGCAAEQSATSNQGIIINTVPGQPGWEPVSPPPDSVCIGISPELSAWDLSAEIAARRAAEAERVAAERAAEAERAEVETDTPSDTTRVTDVRPEIQSESEREADSSAEVEDEDAETAPDTTSSWPEFDLPGLPGDDDAAEGPSDPCSPDLDPAQCNGQTAPEFVAYDFQPQSCGYGATYGLETFKGHVTLAVLLASW